MWNCLHFKLNIMEFYQNFQYFSCMLISQHSKCCKTFLVNWKFYPKEIIDDNGNSATLDYFWENLWRSFAKHVLIACLKNHTKSKCAAKSSQAFTEQCLWTWQLEQLCTKKNSSIAYLLLILSYCVGNYDSQLWYILTFFWEILRV